MIFLQDKVILKEPYAVLRRGAVPPESLRVIIIEGQQPEGGEEGHPTGDEGE